MSFFGIIRRDLRRERRSDKNEEEISKDEAKNAVDEITEGQLIKKITLIYTEKRSLEAGIKTLQGKIMGVNNQKRQVAGNLRILTQKFKNIPARAKHSAMSALGVSDQYVGKLKKGISDDLKKMHVDLEIELKDNSVEFQQLKKEKELLTKEKDIARKLYKVCVDEERLISDALKKERTTIKDEKKQIRLGNKGERKLEAA